MFTNLDMELLNCVDYIMHSIEFLDIVFAQTLTKVSLKCFI